MKRPAGLPDYWLVWLASYAFFLPGLASNYSAAHDSIHYLNDIVKGQNLFHQHHLLYHYFANAWMKALAAVFPSMSKPLLIESFTALWGSSALVMIYAFYRNRFLLSRGTAVLGTMVIAVSYGFWFYSINIEVYLPPLFFVLAVLYVLTAKELRVRDVWAATVLHSAAILFHQSNVLLAAVFIFILFRHRRTMGFAKPLAYYCLAGVLLTGGLYLYIGWFVEGHASLPGWMAWMRGYTVGHGYWQSLSWSTPLHVLTGFAHAFVGGHFLFRLPVIEALLQQSFLMHSLRDEIFLARHITAAGAWVLTVFSIALAVIIIVLVVRFVRFWFRAKTQSLPSAGRQDAKPAHGELLAPLLICWLVYAAFFTFWMPEILEFWILQMVITWLLLIGLLPEMRFPFGMKERGLLMIIVLLTASVNYFGSIRWLQRAGNDWYYVETMQMKDSLSAGDLVIVEDEWILKDYLRYFTKAKVVATDEPGFSESARPAVLRSVMQKGGRVWLFRYSPGEKSNWSIIQSY